MSSKKQTKTDKMKNTNKVLENDENSQPIKTSMLFIG
jgi:hypothetical protein